MNSMIGKILSNRYQIIEQIGSGGMSIVYKAKCMLLNRFVAIKVLRDEFKADAQIVRKFNIESQSAASLSNPNIVSIYDVGQDSGTYYIVMELVEGITLKEFIENSGMLNWRLALKFTIQICSALEHAHKNGIIHRDIKPQNIILTKDGTCKVTDFGIAFTGNVNETRKIESDIMGSVHYISPEQTKGIITDARSDIYSLGITVYEMLTAHVPFDGDNAVAIALKHLNEEPIPIKDINLPVPLGFVNIVKKAMSKDINMRYQDAQEMLNDLELFSGDPTVFEVGEQTSIDLQMTRIISKEEQESILRQIEEIKAETSQDNDYEEKIESRKPVKTYESEKKKEKRKNKEKKKGNFFKELFKIENKQDKIAVIAAIITSVILILAVSGVAASMFFPSFDLFAIFTSGGSEFKVENFEGKLLEEVKEQYKNHKIEFIIEDEVYDNDYEEGRIISQTPKEGMTVKLPAKIRLTVSKGSKEFSLQNYVGEDAKQAKLKLNNLNLKVDEKNVFDDDVQAGYVISQSPKAGSTVRSGDVVVLTISKGADSANVIVPNLIGKTAAEAKSLLEDNNLKIGSTIRRSSSKDEGTVIDQSIGENSEVPKNTKIDIYVSSGKEKEETPEVTPDNPAVTQPTQSSTPAPQQSPAPQSGSHSQQNPAPQQNSTPQTSTQPQQNSTPQPSAPTQPNTAPQQSSPTINTQQNTAPSLDIR